MKKKLKFLLYIGCSLFLLIVFATLLLPSKGQAVGSTTINTSREAVWDQLTNLKSYPKWFPWVNNDQTDILYYGSKKSLRGFSFISNQEETHYGRYEFGEREKDSLLHFEFQVKDLPEFHGDFIIKENNGSAVVVWELNMQAGWKPWWRFYAAIMNKVTKPVLDTGLTRLKRVCEQY